MNYTGELRWRARLNLSAAGSRFPPLKNTLDQQLSPQNVFFSTFSRHFLTKQYHFCMLLLSHTQIRLLVSEKCYSD